MLGDKFSVQPIVDFSTPIGNVVFEKIVDDKKKTFDIKDIWSQVERDSSLLTTVGEELRKHSRNFDIAIRVMPHVNFMRNNRELFRIHLNGCSIFQVGSKLSISHTDRCGIESSLDLLLPRICTDTGQLQIPLFAGRFRINAKALTSGATVILERPGLNYKSAKTESEAVNSIKDAIYEVCSHAELVQQATTPSKSTTTFREFFGIAEPK